MKKLALATTLAAALGLLSAGKAAAQQSSATASAVPVTADVVAAIAITNTGDLNFGQIVAGGTEGTVTLTPLNARSSTGGTKLANGTGVRPATFDVTGSGTDTFSISLPSSPIDITSSGHTMSVDTFATPSSTLALVGGAKTFAVGATLHVGASQDPGHYAGSFNLSVAYN